MEWTVKGVLAGIKKQIDKVYIFFKPYYTWVMNRIHPAGIPDFKQIPIIINNRNRVTCLKRLVDWLTNHGYTNIYIIDNASDYPPLLHYYASDNFLPKVYFLKENVGHLSLWKSGIIKKFESGYFIYTDPDVIPVDECPANFVSFFYSLMQRYPLVEKVGFSLKIDDLPDCFDKKEEVIRWESRYWKNPEEDAPKIYKAAIDTTFAMYRPWFKVGGNLNSPHLRIGYPYTARHIPWYNDSSNLDEEEIYYLNHCATASHWVAETYTKKK